MAHPNQHHLVIIPSVAVWKENDVIIFDRKFYDGILQYAGKWPGKVSCVMKMTGAAPPAFGLIRVHKEELPFACLILREEETVGSEHVREASMVLASGDAFDQLHIAAICQQVGVKCVYVIEYIPETRYQIASLETNNPLLLLRRSLYLRQQEKKRIAAFEAADGLQSNGTPAYDHYSGMKNRLLYFDTRVYRENMITDSDLERRIDVLSQGKPLRLAFSGRLVRMKGADHLVRLALLLKERGMAFTFTIYGTGDLDGEMRAFVERHDLGSQVFMPGAVDFYSRLLPEIQANTDLFVCLHRQSDPSCTYLETLACGVPIVGYANRAFAGILERADIGWGVEMDDLEGVAKVITHLDGNRPEIIGKARNSVVFASQHDFETTFRNRIDHLLSLDK
ncbi:MAG: glycosyltransferase [Chlorobiaceae bacterium]|nr:glycosyltransferase [Chlorobiaceae bacterium]